MNSVSLLTAITSHYENPMTCESEGPKSCVNLSVEFVFDAHSSANSSFYPLILRVSGIKNGRPFGGNYRMDFDKSSLTYPAPKGMPDEVKPFN